MSIAFSEVPSGSLVPFVYVEFSGDRAASNIAVSQPWKILVLGQKLASGVADSNKLMRVRDDGDAARLFGWGSMLHHMFRHVKLNNKQTESFAIALDDPGQPSSRVFKVGLKGAPAKATAYTITLRKGEQSKVITFVSSDAPTVSKILGGLQGKAALDMVTSPTVSGDKLSLAVDSGWVLAVSNNLDLELPAPEQGRAKGSFNLIGTATSDGLLSCYIGDRSYQVPVNAGDTASDIAPRLSSFINADGLSYATASADGSVVEIAAKHRGKVGEEIKLSYNFEPLESFPDGLEKSTTTAMSGGASNPSLKKALSTIDEEQYNVIVSPYSDAQNIKSIHTFLEQRWGPSEPLDGHAFIGISQPFSDQILLAQSTNSKQVSFLDAEEMMTPPYLFASGLAGVNAVAGSQDPARPQQTLEVLGTLGEKRQRSKEDRDSLLNAGVSTHLSRGGRVTIERLVTTNTKNALGADSISYRDLATKQTLSFLRWSFRNYFMTRYPRHKLADDGMAIEPGQPILTPKTAKASVISVFKSWQRRGLVEDIDQFKKELVVQINPGDPNRLDILMPPNLVNQLRVVGAKIEYLL